ncbi:hypothetical protein [Frankia sp. Cj5]|uniref:hypothetical protein n=1 Tax=Frankia sp. Cj5 TaxID=2880978 RepID=UPI001EF66C2E|nr:hypothetical protein [Frankia sp. Cj5]
MRTVDVVVIDVVGHDSGEMPLAEDEQVVEAFAAYGADPSFGVGVRDWSLYRGADDREVVGREYGVDCCGELVVPVADQPAER